MVKASENGEAEKIRISITLDPSLRRNVRIAAAHADLEPGAWMVKVIRAAALQATGKGK